MKYVRLCVYILCSHEYYILVVVYIHFMRYVTIHGVVLDRSLSLDHKSVLEASGDWNEPKAKVRRIRGQYVAITKAVRVSQT